MNWDFKYHSIFRRSCTSLMYMIEDLSGAKLRLHLIRPIVRLYVVLRYHRCYSLVESSCYLSHTTSKEEIKSTKDDMYFPAKKEH